jgi:hypothetical protein
MKTWKGALALVVATLACAAVAVAQTATVAGPAVKPAAVAKKAGAPAPAAAKTAKSVGKTVKASTANGPADSDSFWAERVDVDGDGNVDDSNLVWDDEDGVLVAWTEGAFTCRNGATGEGEIMIAVNAPNNPRKRPAGSGFWLAAVDKSECGAQAAGLVGCRFDANGVETACGAAKLDEANDDLVIVAVLK